LPRRRRCQLCVLCPCSPPQVPITGHSSQPGLRAGWCCHLRQHQHRYLCHPSSGDLPPCYFGSCCCPTWLLTRQCCPVRLRDVAVTGCGRRCDGRQGCVARSWGLLLVMVACGRRFRRRASLSLTTYLGVARVWCRVSGVCEWGDRCWHRGPARWGATDAVVGKP
jgi:hypothetical protein